MSLETKDFGLGDVLSITHDRLVSRRHMEGVYDILNWMTNDNLFTHQLPRAGRECKPWLLRQHPQLKDVNSNNVNKDNWEEWLTWHEAFYGETLPVARIPRDDHTYREPLTELQEMMGSDKKVIVVETGDSE